MLATFEQADARLVGMAVSIVQEAPRLIADLTGTYQKLPFTCRRKVNSSTSEEKWLEPHAMRPSLSAEEPGIALASPTKNSAWHWRVPFLKEG